MNFSELILHGGENINLLKELNKKERKQIIKFKNINLGQTSRQISPKSIIIQNKKQIRNHKRVNNNPRMSLIQKTKQLIQNKQRKNQKKNQHMQHLRPRTTGSMFRGRYISSSSSPRPNRYQQYRSHHSNIYPNDPQIKSDMKGEFLQSTIRKIKLQKKAEIIQEIQQPQVMSLKVHRQFPPSKRRKAYNKSTLQEKKKYQFIVKRQNTTNVLNRQKHKNSYQAIQPW